MVTTTTETKEAKVSTAKDLESTLSDAAARHAAWDVERSWIVEAPAGSGKTELLMQRFLRLLGRVDQPEQVLAITFTRKAAAEMRDRILASLREAQTTGDGTQPVLPHKLQTQAFAREALENDTARGWNLVAQPGRLNIRTIDSLCERIASRLPVLSRMGGSLHPIDNTSDLYRKAAREALEEMGGKDPSSSSAAETLLHHLDNRMEKAVQLLAEMLDSRDHWGHRFPIGRGWSDGELDTLIHDQFEVPLQQLAASTLGEVRALMSEEEWEAVFDLACYAARVLDYNASKNIFVDLLESLALPPCDPCYLNQWKAIVSLLLKQDGSIRKSVDKRIGFEPGTAQKASLQSLLKSLESRDDLVHGLCDVRHLPPPGYTPQQKKILRACFVLLRRALAHLKLAFANSGNTDFTEISIAARNALTDDDNSLALAFGTNIQHLLVDEMQDTSLPHFEILHRLVQSWDGRSQTVFLVGDPKQSIYRFRHVDVRLFDRARRNGLGGVTLEPLALRANFRSRQSLVGQTNTVFEQVFHASPNIDAIHFEGSEAPLDEPETERVFWHPQIRAYRARGQSTPEPDENLALAEATEICDVIERCRAGSGPDGAPPSIAVLVRARNHARVILQQMRARGIPYRAVEFDWLSDRQPLLDLVTITRCLLHPADRIAWLAALRAPWCGLTLADLLILCGNDDPAWASKTVPELFRERALQMSADGQRRAGRTMEILLAAAERTAIDPLPGIVERAWITLGGPDCISEPERGSISDYFQMLDTMERAEESLTVSHLEERMQKLFASPRSMGESPVEVLTLFKAKGLEWDIVLLPGLHRKPPREKRKLVEWMECVPIEPSGASQGETPGVILAPIQSVAEESEAISQWIRRDNTKHKCAELRRLLYVGWTRARQQVHLFGECSVLADGTLGQPNSESLLRAAWPCAEAIFKGALASRTAAAASNVIEIPLAAPGDVSSIAAEIDPGSLTAAATPVSSQIPLSNFHRLGLDWTPPPTLPDIPMPSATALVEAKDAGDLPAFRRPQGSWRARLFGTALHAFLPRLARILETNRSPADTNAAIEQMGDPIRLELEHAGYRQREAKTEAHRILDAFRMVAQDPDGRWILQQHPQPFRDTMQSADPGFEVSISAQHQDSIRSIRVDRMFMAGDSPRADGEHCLWIVDFKTASHGAAGIEKFLDEERKLYEPQLEAYAAVASRLEPADTGRREIRLGLYYPLLPRLVWWRYRNPD